MGKREDNLQGGQVPETSSTMLRALAGGADSLRWTEFVDLYTPVLLFWLRCLKAGPLPSLSPDMFDDIVQETFVSLMKLFPRGGYDRERARFRTLLQTILRKRAIDCLMQSRRASLRFLPQETLERAEEAGRIPAFAGHDDGDDARRLRADFARLLTDRVFRESNFSGQSKAIFLRLGAGESADALAAEYGLERNAIYQMKSRVVAKLTAKARAAARLRRHSRHDLRPRARREGEKWK
ncbi:MAG: sigma-70 family RNA polymerase sigma factor [Kiritimatiellae bacterium]|nr:sigma-70 family RNA polymerase sigma factor [Kiritimatiellia bacterium]